MCYERGVYNFDYLKFYLRLVNLIEQARSLAKKYGRNLNIKLLC